MTPIEYYKTQISKGVVQEDPEQIRILNYFQRVYEKLIKEHQKRKGFWGHFHSPQLIKGIYLWGSVGVGKTFLMDCFFHQLPFKEKIRSHFHHFMQHIHEELKKYQGKIDPLQMIAGKFAKETIVLCFDEFFVSDITDAMLLGRLFKALFENGVCLVTTSNIPPDDLYKYGLQRSQFLPAIELIKQNTEVLYIPSMKDYRLRHFKEAGIFYTPLDDSASKNMEKMFDILTKGKKIRTESIEIHHRKIRIVKEAGEVIWFDFADICSIPRSQNDYIAIAQKYRNVLISNIPIIPENATDTIRLFVNLVDVLYDAGVKLVISAAEPVPEIYIRGTMALEYARTHSRLIEMQSSDYFNNEE